MLCPKGWPSEKCFLWSASPSKLLQHNSRIRFKSQVWCDKIQKKRWRVWKLVNHQTTTFSLLCYFQRLRKKATFSLSNLRLVDQRGSRFKICKFQWIYFEVYKKLEVEEKLVRLCEYSMHTKGFHLLTFSTF